MSMDTPNGGERSAWVLKPRRQRKRGACTNCRVKKIRCDAPSAAAHVPCTNCAAFALSCSNSVLSCRPETVDDYQHRQDGKLRNPMQILENYLTYEADEGNLYLRFMDPELRKAPILEPGRVAYVGESSNLPFLVDDDPSGQVHYQLPENFSDTRTKISKMDSLEIKILRQSGALSLPPQDICDDLVEAYFRWVAPLLPIISKGQFMKQYRDPSDPPSLLLLQAVFLAASTVTPHRALVTSTQFYRRAKAIYDSGYENDRITIIQALLLISWYWETCHGRVEDVMYWNGLAITIALGCGIHRSAERSSFSDESKRLWRRLWWTLVTRDRSTTLLGQVAQIHTDDSDVEMVCEDDFTDGERSPDAVHVRFFIQWVKLCIVVDAVLHRQGILWTSHGTTHAERRDGLLSRWLASRPIEMRWEEPGSGVWATSLQGKYEAAVSFLCE